MTTEGTNLFIFDHEHHKNTHVALWFENCIVISMKKMFETYIV